MRSPQQITKALLADPDFNSLVRVENRDLGSFSFYRLDLSSAKYKGFPPDWECALLLEGAGGKDRADYEVAYEHAREIVEAERKAARIGQQRPPFLLISDEPGIRLHDTVGGQVSHIFVIDHQDIPSMRKEGERLSSSPLIKAIRKHLTPQVLSELVFSPYKKNQPAEGWRFFGRRNELKELINSTASYFVVGGRRIGKSSLLKELKVQLERSGCYVVFVDVETCQNEAEMVQRMLLQLSEKDMAAAQRRHLALSESYLTAVLRRVTTRSSRVVFILDELGNVMTRQKSDQWKILATLREFSQRNDLRVISSCFQELFQRQAKDYGGPLVNFGAVLRLHAMTPGEVEDMVVTPLAHWARANDSRALANLVLTWVGRHPYVVQTFCQQLFQRALDKENKDKDLLAIARSLIDSDSDFVDCFREVTEEIFTRTLTPALRYIYLKRCMEADGNVSHHEFAVDDDWLEGAFESLGYSTTLDVRREMLDELEMRGLIDQRDDRRSQYQVVTPMVFHYHRKTGVDMVKFVQKHAKEVALEASRWGLMRK